MCFGGEHPTVVIPGRKAVVGIDKIEEGFFRWKEYREFVESSIWVKVEYRDSLSFCDGEVSC
jgi:hypothetical protein